MKPGTITGIRLKKFSVGNFNVKTKQCENTWIEIKEIDSDEESRISHSQRNENMQVFKRGESLLNQN